MGGTREPELRILELMSHDAPVHWSRLAVRARLRPSSVQQYLSRLVHRGLVRRVSVGQYVLAEVVSRPAWDTAYAAGTARAVTASGDGALIAWDSLMLAPFLGRDAGFGHLTTAPDRVDRVAHRLGEAGITVLAPGDAFVTGGVLVRAVREASCVLRSGAARPERAAVDLLLEQRHGALPVSEDDVVKVLTEMYRWRMISVSRLLRYAARRGVEAASSDLLARALPETDRRALRGRLASAAQR